MELNWNQSGFFDQVTRITAIDAHAAGEPLRIITGGLPELAGDTILERRRFMSEHLDFVRRALIWEPRGHYNMYGCVLTPPVSPTAHFGVVFMHNEGYSTMCGHGVIALVTALLETGAFAATGAETRINLDTPAGLVRATAYHDAAGVVERVSFLNVPSFVYAPAVEVEVEGAGPLAVDVAFGGAFYAVLPAQALGLELAPEAVPQLKVAGERVKEAVNRALEIRHPVDAELSYLYGTILTGPPADPAHHSRNICIFANAEVDRSPTGTGVSARLALLYTNGEVSPGETIEVESVVGSAATFGGRIVGHVRVGEFDAVVPEVSGSAYISGRHEFILDPRDHLGRGFLIP